MKDLFEHYEQLPKAVQKILSKFGEVDTYQDCEKMLKALKPHGYTFNYYLDAQPYNLRPMVSNKTKSLMAEKIKQFRGIVYSMPRDCARKYCEIFKKVKHYQIKLLTKSGLIELIVPETENIETLEKMVAGKYGQFTMLSSEEV